MRLQNLVRVLTVIIVSSAKIILIIVLIFLDVWWNLVNFLCIGKMFIIIWFCTKINMHLIEIFLAQCWFDLSLKCLRVFLVARFLTQTISIFNIFVWLHIVLHLVNKLRDIIILWFSFFKILTNIILKIQIIFRIVVIGALRIALILDWFLI